MYGAEKIAIIMDEDGINLGDKGVSRPHKDNPPEEDEEAETGKRLLYSYNLYRELLHGQKR
jgi:hypothetical protein